MELASVSETDPELEPALEQKVSYEGVVVREAEVRENATHLYVRTNDALILVKTDRYTNVQYGHKVAIKGTLQKPEAFETELGRSFNYPGYLHARGVSYVIPHAEVSVIGEDEGNPLLASLYFFKHAFMENLEGVLPSPHAGLAEGLLLGVKQALGEDLEEAFVKTGITHIVVLSGYNITLVIVFVMYILSYLFPFRGQLLFGLVAILLFALLVGLSATVLRASLMAILILIAKLTGRTYDVLRALVIAGVLMLIWNPYLLVFDIGFQLSFVATLGLILLSSYLERTFHFMPTFLGLREFLVATVAAQLFVTPLLLYQMGQFSVVSVFVNVLVLPMVPFAMLTSFVTGVIAFISPEAAQFAGLAAYATLWYILFIAETFASFSFSSFAIPPFSFVWVLLMYTALGYAVYWLAARKKKGKSAFLLRGWTIVSEEEYKASLPKPKDPVFFS